MSLDKHSIKLALLNTTVTMGLLVTLVGILWGAAIVHQSLGLFVHKCVRVGVDYGPRLIGLAYSDYFGKVYPHATIRNTGNLTKISEDIAKFAMSLRAREVILGIPLDGSSDGQVSRRVKNMNGKICLNFSFVLTCIVKSLCPDIVKVSLCDESYSTQEAKVKQAFGEEKGSVDAVAAQCILERYLEEEGRHAIDAVPCPYPPPEEIATFDYDLIRTYVKMKNNVEDDEDWHLVKAYVDNYKVYAPAVSGGVESNQDSMSTAQRQGGGNVSDGEEEEDEDEDEETRQQREILARRRPRGMSKARWAERMATNK